MRARFAEAIAWLAWNDDCRWVHDIDPVPTPAAAMCAHIFDKTVEHVRQQIVRVRKAQGIS